MANEGITQYILNSVGNSQGVGWVGGSLGSYLAENGNRNVLKVCLWLISPRENHLREKKRKLCLDWTLKYGEILNDRYSLKCEWSKYCLSRCWGDFVRLFFSLVDKMKYVLSSLKWENHFSILFHLCMESKNVLMNLGDCFSLFSLVLCIILIPVYLLSISSLHPVLKFNALIWVWTFKECLLLICCMFGLSQRWLSLAWRCTRLSASAFEAGPRWAGTGYLESLVDFA